MKATPTQTKTRLKIVTASPKLQLLWMSWKILSVWENPYSPSRLMNIQVNTMELSKNLKLELLRMLVQARFQNFWIPSLAKKFLNLNRNWKKSTNLKFNFIKKTIMDNCKISCRINNNRWLFNKKIQFLRFWIFIRRLNRFIKKFKNWNYNYNIKMMEIRIFKKKKFCLWIQYIFFYWLIKI